MSDTLGMDGEARSGWIMDRCHDQISAGDIIVSDYRGRPMQPFEVLRDTGTGMFLIRDPDGVERPMRPSTLLAVAKRREYTPARAAEVLRAGGRVKVSTGDRTDDPVMIAWLADRTVMSEAIGGWSAGVTEAVCFIDSDYLEGHYLANRRLEPVERSS